MTRAVPSLTRLSARSTVRMRRGRTAARIPTAVASVGATAAPGGTATAPPPAAGEPRAARARTPAARRRQAATQAGDPEAARPDAAHQHRHTQGHDEFQTEQRIPPGNVRLLPSSPCRSAGPIPFADSRSGTGIVGRGNMILPRSQGSAGPTILYFERRGLDPVTNQVTRAPGNGRPSAT